MRTLFSGAAAGPPSDPYATYALTEQPVRYMLTLITLATALGALTGCNVLGRSAVKQADVKELSKRTYPAQAELGDDLDIIVVRDGGAVRLVNRTPRSYSGLQLWINEEWVGDVTTVQIGTDNLVALPQMINEHGERFPVGGILSPDKTLPVVLTEFYDPATSKRHRLNTRVVVPDSVIADLTGDGS